MPLAADKTKLAAAVVTDMKYIMDYIISFLSTLGSFSWIYVFSLILFNKREH